MSCFQLQERGSNVRTELLAGCTTFLTMCYIIFVNPLILADTGMDTGAVLVATCFAAAFGSAVMGLYANYPIALAPGMGLNAYFAAVAVGTLGLPWQAALGAVFCSGVLMLFLSVLPVREWVVNSIPRSQKMAIAAGIGFFLVVIGLRNAGVVVANEATLVGLGDLIQWTVGLAALGFMGIVALEHRQVPGSVVICILAAALAGWIGGLSPAPESVVSAPPSLAPTAFELDIAAALEVGLIAIVFAFLMVDLFDTSGTLVAVLNEAGLTDKDGRVPGLRRAIVADSSATMWGGPGGDIDGDVVYRERRRGAGGRPDRADRPRSGRTVSGCAGVRAGGDRDPRIRYRSRHHLRRVRHGAGPAARGMGRSDRGGAGHRDGDRDAVHLLDSHRDRPRVHLLRGHQAAGGAPPRPEPGGGRGGGAVRDPVRGQLSIGGRFGLRAALIRDVTLHVPPFPEDR